MKRILTSIAIFACTVVLVYLSVAFVKWEFNPGNWSEGARFLTAFMAAVFGLILSITYYTTYDD